MVESVPFKAESGTNWMGGGTRNGRTGSRQHQSDLHCSERIFGNDAVIPCFRKQGSNSAHSAFIEIDRKTGTLNPSKIEAQTPHRQSDET